MIKTLFFFFDIYVEMFFDVLLVLICFVLFCLILKK